LPRPWEKSSDDHGLRAGGSIRPRASLGIAVLGAILALALTAAAAQDAQGASAKAHASIINGEPASIADFPWLAFIVAENEFSCTGTVIAPRVVLTAAHCVQDLERGGFTPPGNYRVVTGRADIKSDEGGNVLGVVETHVFPRFDPGPTRGDAALLVLASPTTAPPIPLATAADSALYEGGATVLLAGWGLTRPGATSAPTNLHWASNVVLDPATCKRRTRSFYPPFSPAAQMCTADPPDRTNGGCFGDSGGPVIAQRADGSPVELGIVSTGGPRCSTQVPNIFTRADLGAGWAAGWVTAIESGGQPPSLRAQLPALTRESAEARTVGTLRGNLGDLFVQNRHLRGLCRRLTRTRMKCEVLWQHGPKTYLATVTVFYALRQNTVAWESNFVVRRASTRCLTSGRRNCPVESRRG
jgi:secreted trypsin-like serine protease